MPTARHERTLKTELLNLLSPERSVPGEEELVELRWFDAGSRQHGVRLTPVMNLVHEQVREYRLYGFLSNAVLPTIDCNDSSESSLIQCVAVLDQV